MPPGSCLVVGDIEYEELHSPAPETSISAVEQPRSQEPASSSSTSCASTRPSRPKKRKLRTPETWKHFRLPQGDEDRRQNSQRLWYCQLCLNPPWRTVSTSSGKRHMRTGHGIVIDDEERPAKKALQQSLEVAFTRAEEKNRELLSCGEQLILRNTIKLDAFYEAQIQLTTRCRLPLNCISWPEYQALLCAVNPRADEILIQSGTTVLAHIERSYALHRENITGLLGTLGRGSSCASRKWRRSWNESQQKCQTSDACNDNFTAVETNRIISPYRESVRLTPGRR